MYIAETVFIIIIIITIIIVIIIILTFMIIIIIIIVFVVVVTMFQNGQVMVTSLGFCCYSRRDPPELGFLVVRVPPTSAGR